MKLHPRLSRAVVELVVRFETFHASAQPATGGGWTVGYGHTRSARDGAQVSREDGEALLLYDLAAAAEIVEASLFAPVSQRQFEALTAFCFNIGAENFRSSSALARLNAGAELEAADEIERWRRAELGAGPQVVDALVRRRAAEKAHFLGLPEGFSKSPRAVLRPLPGADGQGWETPPPPVEPAVPSATLSAANSVQARLRELVPEPDPPPFATPSAPSSDAEPAPDPQAQPELGEPPASQAQADAPPTLSPEPPILAPPSEPHPPADLGRTSPRRPAPYVAPPPPPPPPAGDLHACAANDGAARHVAAPGAPLATFPTAASADAPPDLGEAARATNLSIFTVRRVYMALAAFGACLFLAAAAMILSGRPTLANLVLGVCGVGLMTPGVYGLLGPRLPGD